MPRLTGLPANRATLGGLTSYMLDRVARLPGSPCLLARGTRLGGIAFYYVNVSCRAILASRGEISRENMAARGEFFES